MTSIAEIVVSSEEIISIFNGEQDMFPRGHDGSSLTVMCQGVKVCRVLCRDGQWTVVAVACPHPIHGVHDSYKHIHEGLKKCSIDASIPTDNVCPQCNGEKWLVPSKASQLIATATTLGIFRGIKIPTRNDLQTVEAGDILSKLLSMPEPSGAAVPDRERESPVRQFDSGEKMQKEVSIFCENESQVVGHLVLPAGRNQLTPRTVIESFRPVSERYTLSPKLVDGKYLPCPRCGSILAIQAEAVGPENYRNIVLGMVVEVLR